MGGNDLAEYDYVIVGAGSAGCVLANRLSADPGVTVALLEAGPGDAHPYVHMPRGVGKLMAMPTHMYHYLTQPEAHNNQTPDMWLRGKVLGGSSSVNGMMYFRGQPQDYDGWEAAGATGWGWRDMEPAFRAIEQRLDISIAPDRTPFTEAFIAAGEQMGLRRVADLNHPGQEGVGYAPRTIRRGRRRSSAQAFLAPARRRANLRVITGAVARRLIVTGGRATGIEADVNGQPVSFGARGEIILSAGALLTPQLLQRSGIGDGDHLRGLGIPVIADSPGVGAHMLEHRLMMVRYDMIAPHSDNPRLRGLRLAGNVLRYYLTRDVARHGGPMGAGYGAVGAFARALPDAATPDIEILMTPAVADPDARGNFIPDAAHSLQIFGYPLRSRSEGFVRITDPDPNLPARIHAGYLTDPYDQAVTVAMHRYIRRWAAQPALAGMIGAEREPTRSLETDAQIIAAFRSQGQAGLHACGTCRMGDADDAVLDARLRVRGLGGLRVVDGSIMPTMVSANTNGPIMAAAWRAADLILEDRHG